MGSSDEIKKKRVILTITADPAFDQRMIRVCNSLAKNGLDVLLVGRKLWNTSAAGPVGYRHKRLICLIRKGPLFYAVYNIRLLFILLFYRCDICVAVDLDTILPNRITAGIKGKRLVFDAHEYYTEVPELKNRKLVRWIWEKIGRICVPGADLCYTVSGSLARELGIKYNKHFHVVMNAPELNSVAVSEPAEKPATIIYQGHLNPGRGLEEAIMAIERTDARLLIAGDGPLRRKLERLVTEIGVEQKVTFTGIIDRETLEELTRRASIGLNLLDADSKSYYLSLSNKFFNYIHAGIPQICADFPEYREINSRWKVAVLCEYSVKDLRAAIELLSADSGYYERLRKNCAEAASSLNWQTEEKKLTALFNVL
ncbi:MAG: glycosyltransferase [Bacteroidales bacterium]